MNHVIDRTHSLKDGFFRVLLFSTFNRIETWKLLERKIGKLDAASFDVAKYDKILSHAFDTGVAVYSSAYYMPGPHFGHIRNHSNHLRLIDAMMSLKVYDRLKKMEHLKDAHGYITLFPSMGEFMAMQ